MDNVQKHNIYTKLIDFYFKIIVILMGLGGGEWCIYSVYDGFRNFVLYGDVGIMWVVLCRV
jgi:hypothetical protein